MARVRRGHVRAHRGGVGQRDALARTEDEIADDDPDQQRDQDDRPIGVRQFAHAISSFVTSDRFQRRARRRSSTDKPATGRAEKPTSAINSRFDQQAASSRRPPAAASRGPSGPSATPGISSQDARQFAALEFVGRARQDQSSGVSGPRSNCALYHRPARNGRASPGRASRRARRAGRRRRAGRATAAPKPSVAATPAAKMISAGS